MPSRLIRLAFLSPEITEAILDGRQPLGLTAAKLMQVSRLPLEWRAQTVAASIRERNAKANEPRREDPNDQQKQAVHILKTSD